MGVIYQMRKHRAILLAAPPLALGPVVGCRGSTPSISAPGSSPAIPPARITCTAGTPEPTKVVGDLVTQDKALQEAWVSGGDSGDLQTLINYTNGASGSDQFNSHA